MVVNQLDLLLEAIEQDEAILHRAELFFEGRSHLWPRGLDVYFQDELQRMRDQLEYLQVVAARLSVE